MNAKGHVYLVGAGPGDPKLITIRGREAIERADVLVYDRLANPRLLQWAKPNTKKIYVGKLPDRHTLKQHEINQLLIDLALEGHIVTRLKGGDPSVFGRVGEEAEALVANGIRFDMIPGVTSSIAVPLYAGIPVTHRDFTSSLAIVTGHECTKKEDSSLDWEKLAQATGTMVFLMGVKNVSYLCSNMIRYGRSETTPVAVVQWGTSAFQRTIIGNLQTIEQDIKESGITSPAVIVVGEVVNLRNTLNWFETKPLFGKRIVVTRARAQSSSLVDHIDLLGGEAIELPVIEVTDSDQGFDLSEPEKFNWIVFTSVNAVEHFFKAIRLLNVDARRFAKARIAAIGQATADALASFGWLSEVCPGQQDRDGLLQALQQQIQPGSNILLPRGNLASNWLPDRLQEFGANIQNWTVYSTKPVTEEESMADIIQELRVGRINAITFTSSSTVQHFIEPLKRLLGDEVQTLLTDIPFVCIGPQTAETAITYGFGVIHTANSTGIDGLIEKLLEVMLNRAEGEK